MKEIIINGVKIKYSKNVVTIVDSYKITNKYTMHIILNLFKLRTRYTSNRTIKSWVKEWKSHNRLYKLGLFKSHTKDCDLEEHEKLHRLLIYEILGF